MLPNFAGLLRWATFVTVSQRHNSTKNLQVYSQFLLLQDPTHTPQPTSSRLSPSETLGSTPKPGTTPFVQHLDVFQQRNASPLNYNTVTITIRCPQSNSQSGRNCRKTLSTSPSIVRSRGINPNSCDRESARLRTSYCPSEVWANAFRSAVPKRPDAPTNSMTSRLVLRYARLASDNDFGYHRDYCFSK